MTAFFSRVQFPGTAMAAGDYGLHQALWRLFPGDPGLERDFLFHQLRDRPDTCYVVSRRAPRSCQEWSIQTREYCPTLRLGQLLEFALRANPTVARVRKGQRSARHDVVFDARRRAQASGATLSLAEAEQTAGSEWLACRAEACGFNLEQLRVSGYLRRAFRKGQRGRTIVCSTLDYQGILRVTDPERLAQVLLDGVGPARAFGCGLLLVRRA